MAFDLREIFKALAEVKDLDGVPIPVASIRHLIRLKQAQGGARTLTTSARCARLPGKPASLRHDMSDPLQCTYADAARNHLRDGIRMSTAAKVDFFEEMVALAVHFGARNRTKDRGVIVQSASTECELASGASAHSVDHDVPR
jgi:hypothetical protein